MRIFFLATALLCFRLLPYAQLPQVYLNAKQSQALGALSRNATLVVVIENEKNADDAMLIGAIKGHWSIGPVKYMSGLEFSEKVKAQSLDQNNLYLFNSYTRELKYTGGVVVTMNPSKMMSMPAIRRGYYLTNAPNQLINSFKNKNAPPYLHFSSEALYDSKGEPNKGFYDLMVMNFNHDVRYCQDEKNLAKKKKKKRRNGVHLFTDESLIDKTILLVKEQTEKQEKKTKEGETKKSQASKKKDELETDKYIVVKKTVVVFPEDIAYAVKKNDRDIILFNRDCLYSALDGSVYATTRGQSPGGNLFGYFSILLSIAAIAFFVIAIQR